MTKVGVGWDAVGGFWVVGDGGLRLPLPNLNRRLPAEGGELAE